MKNSEAYKLGSCNYCDCTHKTS